MANLAPKQLVQRHLAGNLGRVSSLGAVVVRGVLLRPGRAQTPAGGAMELRQERR